MALRSLVVKLKALPLPRRVPGAGFFATTRQLEHVCSELSAALADHTRYSSMEEMHGTIRPLLRRKNKLQRETNDELVRMIKVGVTVIGVTGVAAGAAIGYEVGRLSVNYEGEDRSSSE